jgi:hypothetical protein
VSEIIASAYSPLRAIPARQSWSLTRGGTSHGRHRGPCGLASGGCTTDEAAGAADPLPGAGGPAGSARSRVVILPPVLAAS